MSSEHADVVRDSVAWVEPPRAEQTLGAVVQEPYVNGVSTRKVDRLLERPGIASMNEAQVSRLCRGLDEQVTRFRGRRLEGRYPYPMARGAAIIAEGLASLSARALTIGASPTFEPGEAGDPAVILWWTARTP